MENEEIRQEINARRNEMKDRKKKKNK